MRANCSASRRPTTSKHVKRPSRLSAALACLPVEQREVVELKTYAGLTLAEIAEVTGAPPGTVATRYRAGLEKLKLSWASKCRE